MNPIWSVAHTGDIPHAALQGEREVDTAIIGGGVTGLTTALKLLEAGQSVAVLEAHQVGSGSTGRSTGNLYGTLSQHLSAVRKKHDDATIKSIAQLRMRALDDIEHTTQRHQIDCDFARHAMYLCVHRSDPRQEESLEEELEASRVAGLSAKSVDSVPGLPFGVRSAVKIDNQAQYNPQSYVLGLARVITKLSGLVFEKTKVVDVDAGSGTVTTDGGIIKAQNIVFATHTPKGVNLLQAEMEPFQEYGISAELKNDNYPSGLFWLRDDSISLRSYQHSGKRYLVVIGGKHKTGHSELGSGYYDMLKDYASRHFSVARFVHQWSAQQYKSADQLPYIGRSGHNNVFVGTGYAADGLTWGAVAAELITQQILGAADSAHVDMFNPRRFTPIKSARSWLKENTSVAKHLLQGHLSSTDKRDFASIKKGQGEVVERDGKKLAVSRGQDDKLTVVSAECPHMKCLVNWNGADATWDCPCHGSRFTPQGDLIEGPAYEGLAAVRTFDPAD